MHVAHAATLLALEDWGGEVCMHPVNHIIPGAHNTACNYVLVSSRLVHIMLESWSIMLLGNSIKVYLLCLDFAQPIHMEILVQ